MASCRPPTIAGRLFGTLVLTVFLGAGLLFAWLLGGDLSAKCAPYFWTKTDAVILDSGMREDNSREAERFEFTARFQFQFEGEPRSSEQFTIGKQRFSNLADVARLKSQYAPGSRTECWVDPKPPHDAVLKRPAPWMALVFLFPLTFILIGGGGIYFLWRDGNEPVSERTNKGSEVATMRLMGLVFFAAGAVAAYFLVLQPGLRIYQARSWMETPCRIISSRVISHRGSKGTTYSVEVWYSYEAGGRKLESNRYNFFTGSSSGYSGKQAVVSRFPSRSDATCFVNPEDPNDAVIDRGFSTQMWFGLIPLFFLCVGGSLVVSAPRMVRRRPDPSARFDSARPARIGGSTTVPEDAGLPSGPQELKPAVPPFAKLAALLFGAIFWCGIVSVFIFHAVEKWQHGRTEWFLTIFLVPFVVIGLGLIGMVLVQFLALFNPRIVLRANSKTVRLGEALQLDWTLNGRTGKVRRLQLVLEGREEATSGSGKNASTSKNVFVSLPILDSTEPGAITAGSARLIIPAGLMHTFAGTHNKIVWYLSAKGEIPRWPDIAEEYVVTVLPLKNRK